MSKKEEKDGRYTRRQFIQTAAAVAAGSTLATRASARDDHDDRDDKRNPPGHTDADLILENGKIHTMDGKSRVVSTVAIKNGRFLSVGEAHPGPRTQMINLRGRTVVPGIIDNHNHMVLMGNRPGYHTPLENALSVQEALQIYAARAAGLPSRDKWITTIGGFHTNHLYANPSDKTSGRFPTLAELDSAVPNNPVFMMISFTGPGATNSAGKALLQAQGVTVGPTATNPDPGAIGSSASTGCPRALLYLRQTLLNPAERRRSVIDAMNHALLVGVTTHLDQGAFQATNTTADGAAHEDNFTMHIPFLQIYDQGKGSVRLQINFLHMEADQNTPELVQRLKNAFPFLGNEWVKTGGIGEFIAQGTNTASPFVEAAKKVARAGWRAEVHSLGRRNTPTSNPADFEFEIMGFEAANVEVPG